MYLLKSAACLAILLLFYKFLLEKENMHGFKRFYLLMSALVAIVIPLITIKTYVEPTSENLNSFIYSSEVSPEIVVESSDYFPYIFFGIYLLGVLFFSIKFFRNLRSLIIKIRTNPKLKSNSFINVLLSEEIQPHTFFSYIFFNKEKYLQNEIPKDVKIHEEAHARQKHSLDVLFIELFQIIFWFNPLLFILKDAVKLNHEFLADKEVIKNGISTSGYQQTLLEYSSRDLQCDLVNPINYSSIKKRFTVMKTKTSRKTVWVRSLLLLPLAATLFYGFSTKEVIEKEVINPNQIVDSYEILELMVDEDGQIFRNNKKVSLSEIENLDWEKFTDYSINASGNAPKENIQELIEMIMAKRKEKEGKITLCTYGPSESEDNVLNEIFQQVPQEKATPKMVSEYNKLVRYYNSMPKDKRMVKQEDINRMMAILSNMTSEQKAKAEKINFDVPPPPPPAPEAVHPAPPHSEKGKLTPPPSPPVPTEHMKELATKGAVFYFEGKEITGKEAIQIAKKIKAIHIQVKSQNSKKPIVKLSKDPFVAD
ncbi:M56 family metallopeptidase [Gillisia hiemivivida]|nr:M56 family metallopeptidase [Gillisia hiemivivida]